MISEVILSLIKDVGMAVSDNNAYIVKQLCNALYDQLKRINIDNITSPEVAATFLWASKVVQDWSNSVLRADFASWDSVALALTEGVQSYLEPRSDSGCALIRGVLGSDFVDTYGEKFTCELVSYYAADKECDIEWKKGKLMSMWRYFESNRKSIAAINPDFNNIIGKIENQFSVRHGDKRQQTEQFMENHADRDYERLLDYAFMVLITSFACLHFTTSIKPKIDCLLNSGAKDSSCGNAGC